MIVAQDMVLQIFWTIKMSLKSLADDHALKSLAGDFEFDKVCAKIIE